MFYSRRFVWNFVFSARSFVRWSYMKVTHLLGVTSLPAEGGGPSLTVEGECGTFKYAITIVYAFSFSRLRRQRLAAARARSGSDSHLGCHSIPSRRFTTSRKEPLCCSCGRRLHLHNTLSLPAEGGGLRSKTEGECGTFKSAITIVYAFSLTRLCRERLAAARSRSGTDSHLGCHSIPSSRFATSQGKALCYSCGKQLTCWRC